MYNADRRHSHDHEHSYQAAFHNRQDGIALLDRDGTIYYLNPAWKKLLGSRDAEVLRVGNNYFEILDAMFDPENRTYARALAHSLQTVASGERDHIELEYPHDRAGQWRWFLVRISLCDLHDQCGILLEQRDITEMLQTQAIGRA
jgi:PAS domain S-box-containing protein